MSKLLGFFTPWRSVGIVAALALLIWAGFAGKAAVDNAYAVTRQAGFDEGEASERAKWDASIAEDQAEGQRASGEAKAKTEEHAKQAARSRAASRKAADDARAEILGGDDPVGAWLRCLQPLYAAAGETFSTLPAAPESGAGPGGIAPADALAFAAADPQAGAGDLSCRMLSPEQAVQCASLKRDKARLLAYSCDLTAALAEERERANRSVAVIDEWAAASAALELSTAPAGPPAN